MNNMLEIHNFNKSYDTFSLNDVSFEIPTGYIMGFIGPNGAGKTTTIKSVLNMIGFDSGEIKIFGLNSTENGAQINDQIGVVMDSPFYVGDWTMNDVETMSLTASKNNLSSGFGSTAWALREWLNFQISDGFRRT